MHRIKKLISDTLCFVGSHDWRNGPGTKCVNCGLQDIIGTSPFQKIICIDFDGVLHSYTSGWNGVDVVKDDPVRGCITWLRQLIEDERLKPVIYSSRSKDKGGVSAMMKSLSDWGLTSDELLQLEFPTQKPAAWLTIDDRAFHFEGDFPSIDFINNFKPWNK